MTSSVSHHVTFVTTGTCTSSLWPTIPPWYNLLQNDASLAGTFFLFGEVMTFEGGDTSMLSGAGKARAAHAGAHRAAPLLERAGRPSVIRARE